MRSNNPQVSLKRNSNARPECPEPRQERPLTGGEAVAAGVSLQLLLTVLAVKIILAGRAQVHWHGGHTTGGEGHRHTRQRPGLLVTSGCLRLGATSQSSPGDCGGTDFLRANPQRKNLYV